MLPVKFLVIAVAAVLVVGLTLGFIFLSGYGSAPASSSNGSNPTPESSDAKAYFSGAPDPNQTIGLFYSSAYVNNALYAINLVNNTTKPVHGATVEYDIWLQFNNGSSTVVDYPSPASPVGADLQPWGSMYVSHSQIPSASTQNHLYQIPADATWIKTTIKDIYGYTSP